MDEHSDNFSKEKNKTMWSISHRAEEFNNWTEKKKSLGGFKCRPDEAKKGSINPKARQWHSPNQSIKKKSEWKENWKLKKLIGIYQMK